MDSIPSNTGTSQAGDAVIRFKKVRTIPPTYHGPLPLYRADSNEPGFTPCLLRNAAPANRQPRWETAQPDPLPYFCACPISDASATRTGAVRAHQFYHSISRNTYRQEARV